MTMYGKCILAVAALTLAGAAHAASGGSASGLPGVFDFDRLDVNHDGVITRDEIPKDDVLLRARFASYDVHHNLRLDRIEFKRAVASLRLACSQSNSCRSLATDRIPIIPM